MDELEITSQAGPERAHLAKPIRLEVDADRDGVVGVDESGRWDWTWRPTNAGGRGAIVLPNLDRDPPAFERDLAELRVVVEEGALLSGAELALGLDPAATSRITISRRGADDTLIPFVGAGAGREGTAVSLATSLARSGETLAVEAQSFADDSFSGLVEVFLLVLYPDGTHEVSDKALLRVAPWIATPNTLAAEVVYAVDLGAGQERNSRFVRELRASCEEAGTRLELVVGASVEGDRWIQDEIEFGYAQSPTHALAVVCDGPRDRPLDRFAELSLLGPDLGVVEVHSYFGEQDSLDSFGNLEVSPPVTATGIRYPLGRIVIGTKRPEPSRQGYDRKATLVLRKFLLAQLVQAPFDIHTDWLAVGHVDEILSFVPGPGSQGFQVLVASPRFALRFFDELRASGGGQLTLWREQQRIDAETGERTNAEETVDDLHTKLAGNFGVFNRWCQEQMDDVVDDLQRELGLVKEDFLEIPVLFKDVRGRALAYFPDMVNHLVLGGFSIVPRPYGPLRDQTDLLEQTFRDAVPHRQVRFIDDWLPYHEMSGEVHCGTNVRRRPDTSVRWWEHKLPGLTDASARPSTS